MINRRSRLLSFACLSSLLLPSLAMADVEDFSGPAGTVVAGALPGGGSAPGTLYPKMTISVVNTGGGPQSAILFDTANPTGNDPDLGSPNNTCGGPGVGTGGQLGQLGENCVPLGNVLIIAEDIVDTSPSDGVVDDPDDEAGGGTLRFDFDAPVTVYDVVILDIDNESANFILENDGTLKGSIAASDLGDNSAQTLDLSSYGEITCLELSFSSSGAISSIEFFEATVPVQNVTWGQIKISN